jgi:hypothetical protein
LDPSINFNGEEVDAVELLHRVLARTAELEDCFPLDPPADGTPATALFDSSSTSAAGLGDCMGDFVCSIIPVKKR